MNKAVFIDRDGVINSDEGLYYIWKEADFKLNTGVVEGIKTLYNNEFEIIIISNQGGIGLGMYTRAQTEHLHSIFLKKMNENGIEIREIYYCPHHPKTGMCTCRKPQNLMIEKAIARFGIDRTHSFLIGDSIRDIEAGEASSLICFKIESNENIEPICKQIVQWQV